MKTLRQISAVITLSLTLAVSVLAGDIDSPGKASTGTATTSVTTTVILTVVRLIFR